VETDAVREDVVEAGQQEDDLIEEHPIGIIGRR
jgi:hypothetical protein